MALGLQNRYYVLSDDKNYDHHCGAYGWETYLIDMSAEV